MATSSRRMHNPYPKAIKQQLSASGVPVISQCSQDPVASQERQKQPATKRKFVSNPYAQKKAPPPPSTAFDEFDDGLDDNALLLALSSAEHKRRIAPVSPKTATVSLPNQFRKSNAQVKPLTRGAKARESAARQAQQYTTANINLQHTIAPASNKPWDSPSHHQPHRITPSKPKKKARYELDDDYDDDALDNDTDDEFEDGIDEESLVAALEAAETNRSSKSACAVTPVASPRKMPRPVVISPPDKPPQTRKVQFMRHSNDDESIEELKPAAQTHTPTDTAASIRGPRGPGSCVLDSCVPRSLFATNLQIPTTNHPDDVSALTMDPIVSSQDDDDDKKLVEDPAVKALKLRLISMSTNLEKVLKRKFNHYCRPGDSLMDCIDRLRRKNLIPSDLADSMSDIRWLGHVAGHRPTFPVKRSEIDSMIRQYQTLRAENSKRL